MPSIHVESTTLFVCYAFTWRRWAGWLMGGFWCLVLLGSVAPAGIPPSTAPLAR